MIIEYLKDTFDHIVFYDSEFKQDIKEKGERPHVVCFVYKEKLFNMFIIFNLVKRIFSEKV